MIIACTVKLQVGTVIQPHEGQLTDAFGNHRERQPLYIVREATRAEYIKFLCDEAEWRGAMGRLIRSADERIYPYCYEISTD